MSDHDNLNFFDPNHSIPAHYENQLTRAFLVVLRISPAAHKVWLSLAAPRYKLNKLPLPNFDTQRWQMFKEAPKTPEEIDGVSVLQSADVSAASGRVRLTNRGQVLDGIVRYGDELVIVIETKLDGPVATRQAQNLNVHGASVRFSDRVRAVSWRELLAAWSNLIEKQVVTGSERIIIEDFLDFVDRHFSRLGPFTTLGQCKGHEFLINRRLSTLLDEVAESPTEGWLDLSGRSTVDRAFLEFEKSSQLIWLKVYPADTLTQARAFYARRGPNSKVLSLRDEGWMVKPNFHFAFMAKGLVWTTTDSSLEDYIAYWREQIESTGAVPREKWGRFWTELIPLRFARTNDRAEFSQHFARTARKLATPRPGLKCFYSWSLTEAKAMDDKHQFHVAVVHQLAILLEALGEEPMRLTG